MPGHADRSLTTLRNIGPVVAAQLVRAGIPDAPTLRALGVDAAYARLLASGVRPHFVAYLALAMALEGRAWTECRGEEKASLRAAFDAVLERRTQRAASIDAALREIGLLDPDGR